MADAPESWRSKLLEDDAAIGRLLARTRSVAVLGIKTEAQSDRPAFYVPRYLAHAGLQVIPVPVYFPEAKEILGRPVFRRLADIPRSPDLVNVFRRPADIPAHLDDILACGAKAVWFQLGIRHDAAAERLARAGVEVVQDRCIMVELARGASAPRTTRQVPTRDA